MLKKMETSLMQYTSTSLIHFDVELDSNVDTSIKVNEGFRSVLRWMSATCFQPFLGILNSAVFSQTLFSVIDLLLDKYQVPCKLLGQINQDDRDKYTYKTAGLLRLIEQFTKFFGLMVSNLIFGRIEQLSITLSNHRTI